MPLDPKTLAERYDRISLRVTRGIKDKLKYLADINGIGPTEQFERLISEAYEKSTRVEKKEHRKG